MRWRASIDARARAQRQARLQEAAVLSQVRTGNLESIFGRILLPGEVPSTTPVQETVISDPED